MGCRIGGDISALKTPFGNQILARPSGRTNIGVMTYAQYLEYLQTPAWRLKAAKVRMRADWRCEVCNCDALLDVHHLTYAHLGDESLLELIALCGPCHARGHFRPYEPNATRQLAFDFVDVAFVSRRTAKADLRPGAATPAARKKGRAVA